MSFKPEDVRIPHDWYYYGPETENWYYYVPETEKEEHQAPPMYDQAYVDSLKSEIEYYRNRYRDLLLAQVRRRNGT